MPLTPRHLRRYRHIAEVMARHGFGALLSQLELGQRLELPRRLLRRSPSGETTSAEHLRLALEELGPTFVKFGQILSTRPDLIPPPYLAELGKLQDRVPPEPWEVIRAKIETELGAPLESLFLEVDPDPLAAASLAQVHAATLESGEAVVIKVQRPAIENTIELDLDILYDLAQLAQARTSLGEIYDLVEIAESFARTLWAEMDYRREGRNADRFRANFRGEPYLYIPRIYWDYTSRRLLVLERIHGIKIDDIAALDAAGYDRPRVAQHSARIIIKEVLEDGFFHADPHPGNFVVMPGEVIGVMDFGLVGHLDPTTRIRILRLYLAAVQLDAVTVVDQLVRMGVAGARLDEEALQRDVHQLLLKYQGLSLKEVRASELVDELMPLAFRHHLRLPSDLWLLGKTLSMMEGVGRKLDPDFDVFAISKGYVRRLTRELLALSEWAPTALRGATDWAELLAGFPRQTTRLLTQLERGNLELRVATPDLAETSSRLERSANRLILGILLAAFILALGLVLPALDLTWPWSALTWLVLLGFAAVSLLALWVLVAILRSGRP